MKSYHPAHYAEALRAACAEHRSPKERQEIFRRFLNLLWRNHDTSKLAGILKDVERLELRARGLQKIEIASVAPLSPGLRREIKEIVGRKNVINEVLREELLAGIRVLINDEFLIDASGKRQLERMFPKSTTRR